ncbi:MAG: J domain-containing protein, partial [Chloroflexi bacterium]|nr:J domain-containing protein [Chloroflexota bacterium]
NLKVSRDAPQEVIKAAYRILSKKYHPDLHPADIEATRVMGLINVAYEVLSDPIKRKEHDEWIEANERTQPIKEKTAASHSTATSQQWSGFYRDLEKMREKYRDNNQGKSSNATVNHSEQTKSILFRLNRPALILSLLLIGLFILIASENKHSSYSGKPYIQDSTGEDAHSPSKLGNNRTNESNSESNTSLDDLFTQLDNDPGPAKSSEHTTLHLPTVPAYPVENNTPRWGLDPNGRPWPSKAGYIKGFKQLHMGGHSRIHVDNSQSNFDAFIKLVYLDGPSAYPVRVFFIPAYKSFTISKINAGSYDLRYRDLSSGALFRTESFQINEESNEQGVRYTRMTLTIYKLPSGNMQTTPISEDQF